METILKTLLVLVTSDQGNFLLRSSLITPFPIPITNEYMEEISNVFINAPKFFSFVKNEKKNKAIPKDIQSNIIKFFRFIIKILS